MKALALALAACVALAAPGAAQPPTAEPPPAAFRQDVAWSPDGLHLAWSEFSIVRPDTAPGWNIWIGTPAGTNILRAVPRARWVDWAPDGRRLVYSSNWDGDWDVYTSKLDGTDVKRITHGPAKDRQPAWSPRGDRIAFVSDRAGHQQVYLMNPDGGSVRRVSADTSEASNPAWSPDGSRLVWFARDFTGDRIHLADADGSNASVVPIPDAGAIHPCFLRNGRLLFTGVTPAGRKLLTTIEPDGSDPQLVGGIEAFFARPSRDGRRIAFLSGSWPRSRIGVVRSDGIAARVVVGDPRE